MAEYRNMYEFHGFSYIPAELSLKLLNPYEVDAFLQRYHLVTLKIQEKNLVQNGEEEKYSANQNV